MMRAKGFVWAVLPATCCMLQCVGDSGVTTDAGPDVSTGQDSGTDTSTGPDVGADTASSDVLVEAEAGPACDPKKAFGAPTPLVQVNTANTEEEARVSATGLELFVTSYASGQPRRIQRYTRTSTQGPWTFQSTLNELNVSATDGGVTTVTAMTPTSDGLTAYLQWYDAPPSANASIGAATRASIGATWTAPVLVNGVDSNFSDEAPWLSADGQRLYFFSTRSGSFHTFVATKNVNGFNAPQALGLNMTEDRYPVLTADELTLYIGAYGPPPDGGAASMNVYVATRTSIQNNFGTPTFVSELNALGSFTAPSWVSGDGCNILLFSQRQGSAGFDVYTATKPL